MKSRSWMLLGVLFVSPAWSQEPATHTPVLTPQSFDRGSDSIKKIVRDAAAAQSVPAQPSDHTPARHEPDATFKYVPPVEVQPPAKIPAPRLPAPAPASDGFVSTLVDILLDVDSDDTSQVRSDESLACLSGERYTTCPGVDRVGEKPSDPSASQPLHGR